MGMLHDFCLSFPYSCLLALGGLMGYLKSGSMMSLGMGGGMGSVIFLMSLYSMAQFKKGRIATEATMVNLVLSSIIAMSMGSKWQTTGKAYPAGVIALMTGSMCVFYVAVLTSPPKVKKKD